MTVVTATEVQNNFGKYLKLVQEGHEIVITRNGSEIARLISKEETVSFLSDALVGIISRDVNEKEAKEERMMRY